MSDLDRARRHLLSCQASLAAARRLDAPADYLTGFETLVLAALCWVWDEQQRAAGAA